MRYLSAYYLLLFYLTILIRPIVPILENFLDHEFSETIHVSTIHARFGSNHLEVQLAAKSSENRQDKENNTLGYEMYNSLYTFKKESFFSFSIYQTINNFPLLKCQSIDLIFLAVKKHPPKSFV